MSFKDEYFTDQSAEESGAWVTEGLPDGVAIKVRHAESHAVATARENARRRIAQHWKPKKGLPPDIDLKNQIELAAALLVDWKGVTDAAGVALPCTPENARRLCEQSRRFRQDVLNAGSQDDNFRAQLVEDTAGNASAPSAPAGSSGTV